MRCPWAVCGFLFPLEKPAEKIPQLVSRETLTSVPPPPSCTFVLSYPRVFLGAEDCLIYASCVYDSFSYTLHFPPHYQMEGGRCGL